MNIEDTLKDEVLKRISHSHWKKAYYVLDDNAETVDVTDLVEQALQNAYRQGKEDTCIQFGLKDNPETLQDNGYYAISVSKDEVEQYLSHTNGGDKE